MTQFVIHGSLRDNKLLTALQAITKAGYTYTVMGEIAESTRKSHVKHAKQVALKTNGQRKINRFHAEKTGEQIVIDLVKSGMNIKKDIVKEMFKMGFAKGTPYSRIHDMEVNGVIKVENGIVSVLKKAA